MDEYVVCLHHERSAHTSFVGAGNHEFLLLPEKLHNGFECSESTSTMPRSTEYLLHFRLGHAPLPAEHDHLPWCPALLRYPIWHYLSSVAVLVALCSWKLSGGRTRRASCQNNGLVDSTGRRYLYNTGYMKVSRGADNGEPELWSSTSIHHCDT